MADLNKGNEFLGTPESQSSNGRDKLTLATAALAIALSTSVQAGKLLEECDFNRNGVIDTPQMHGLNSRAEYRQAPQEIRDLISKERECEISFETSQIDENISQTREVITQTREEITQTRENIAKNREEIAKIDLILAMLSPEEHRNYLENEILKIEEQLKIETNEVKINDLNAKLGSLKELLSKLDNNFA